MGNQPKMMEQSGSDNTRKHKSECVKAALLQSVEGWVLDICAILQSIVQISRARETTSCSTFHGYYTESSIGYHSSSSAWSPLAAACYVWKLNGPSHHQSNMVLYFRQMVWEYSPLCWLYVRPHWLLIVRTVRTSATGYAHGTQVMLPLNSQQGSLRSATVDPAITPPRPGRA